MKEVLIKADKITKAYRLPAEEIKAVREVDLEIHKGEFVAVMGPSGSGKTTLLDIIGCLDRITSGRLQVLGKDVSRVKESFLVKMRRGNILSLRLPHWKMWNFRYSLPDCRTSAQRRKSSLPDSG
jgi:putative ABC transport system ATP-binding protein